MESIAQAIAAEVREQTLELLSTIDGRNATLRVAFNGPPLIIMERVLRILTANSEWLMSEGHGEKIPIVLALRTLPPGASNPTDVTQSGFCDEDHLTALRNSPNVKIFIALIPPNQQVNITQASTRSEIGLQGHNNSGTATIEEWWEDPFIQKLVDLSLVRHRGFSYEWRDEAHRLIQNAIYAADSFSKHDAQRVAPWQVLSRIWDVPPESQSPSALISLATGHPPTANGGLDSGAQISTLDTLAKRFEDASFRAAFAEFLEREPEEIIVGALASLKGQLENRCEVITTLKASMPYFYNPCTGGALEEAPRWWEALTVEAWQELLGGTDEVEPKGKLLLECLNPVTPPVKGIGAIVQGEVILRIVAPEGCPDGTEVLVTRKSGGASNSKEWRIRVGDELVVHDSDPPPHKTPIRYTAQIVSELNRTSISQGSIRVVSLDTWAPGVLVTTRAVVKAVPTKAVKPGREKVAFQTSLQLSGHGRHYMEVFVAEGVIIQSDVVVRGDDDVPIEAGAQMPLFKAGESEYGFEAAVDKDCYYQFQVVRQGTAPEVFRAYLSAEADSEPVRCASEFSRLMQLNVEIGTSRAASEVYIDRQLRISDLQTWMLEQDRVARSSYPMVFARDYAEDWRKRSWESEVDTVFSNARFLNDPRPSRSDFIPPDAFVCAREFIAAKIRGEDGDGLIEAAKLGEWIATDSDFAEAVHSYLRSYFGWLTNDRQVAAWCDVSIVCQVEEDGRTLAQEPEAVIISPLHPIRLAWHCQAQQALFSAQRKAPCPAASILDPSGIPDAVSLPIASATGEIIWKTFFSVKSSSDYWAVLWNSGQLGRLSQRTSMAPFNQEFGLTVGGVTSGFSVAQVHRALDNVSDMLAAKPAISIMVSNSSGHTNACSEGIISWSRREFSNAGKAGGASKAINWKSLQVLDERQDGRPEHTDISNLAEDTANAVKWFDRVDQSIVPDLGIIAQLETSNVSAETTLLGSPLGIGGLLRTRVRQQLRAGRGSLLLESRMALPRPATDHLLADLVASSTALLENLAPQRLGFVFAPSVHSISDTLSRSEFAAVSSSAIDPACFLGGWLDGAYLWDFDLPAYSSRAGDSNGYYLLSRLKQLDVDTMRSVVSKLPGCGNLADEEIRKMIIEVARRGIPTIRGLSNGSTGASGDLGLLIATRLLQDAFNPAGSTHEGILKVLTEVDGGADITLVMPIDPFKGYLSDLSRALKRPLFRPDLLVAGISVRNSAIQCRLTPVEVKFRNNGTQFSSQNCREALSQAVALSTLLEDLRSRANEPDMLLWKLSFHHLLATVLEYGFRVYSQQEIVLNVSGRWSDFHSRVMQGILSEDMSLDIDPRGRLIVVDGCSVSAHKDADGDGFSETIFLTHADASQIILGNGADLLRGILDQIGSWDLIPGVSGGASSHMPDGIPESTTASDANVSTPNGPALQGGVMPPDTELAGEADNRIGEKRFTQDLASFDSSGAAERLPSEAEVAATNSEGADATNASQSGIVIRVGRAVDGFRQDERRLNLGDTNLNQLNIGVVGDLGTGKTQLLKSLVYQISRGAKDNRGVPPNFLIFDYKKDYSSDDFVQAVDAKVVRPKNLPINVFDTTGASNLMTPWLDRYKFFADVLQKVYSNIGPVQLGTLKRAVKSAYEHAAGRGSMPTIYDINDEYQALIDGRADSVSSIIEDFVDMETFSRQPIGHEGVDEFLKGVVVISLDALSDDRSKNMIVAFMLNIFFEKMLRTPKRGFVGVPGATKRVVDSFLLVDEADNIMKYEFDVLRKLLLQGREFGFGIVLASQYLKHFKAGATDYREPLLTWLIHKVPDIKAQELSALGMAGNMADLAIRIKELRLHECLFKTHNVPGEIVRGTPFYEINQNEA